MPDPITVTPEAVTTPRGAVPTESISAVEVERLGGPFLVAVSASFALIFAFAFWPCALPLAVVAVVFGLNWRRYDVKLVVGGEPQTTDQRLPQHEAERIAAEIRAVI